MKSLTIIRVEHSDGNGMFTENILDSNGKIAAGTSPRHHIVSNILPEVNERHYNFPLRRTEFPDCTPKDYCAYKSIDQIKEWLTTEEIKFLSQHGYKVLMLDVTNYQIGEYQVVYTKDSIISQKDITSLFI